MSNFNPNDLSIEQLKAVKTFIETQNLLFNLKLQELENKPNELLTVMFTGPQKTLLKEIIEQNKTFLEIIKNAIINQI